MSTEDRGLVAPEGVSDAAAATLDPAGVLGEPPRGDAAADSDPAPPEPLELGVPTPGQTISAGEG